MISVAFLYILVNIFSVKLSLPSVILANELPTEPITLLIDLGKLAIFN